MALERFIPKSPDMFIRNSQDFEVAKFGHLNTIVEYINNNTVQPAGLNGYVQFNDNNALGGDAGLFWDNVNKSLGLGSSTPSYLSFKYNPSSGSTYVGGINIYQDGVNLFPIMDFTRFGDTVFRRQQRAIFIYYTNENNGINYTNGQLVSQIETTGVRNGIVGSTLFREGVVYNGDGITRRGRYSHGVAQQSGFGGFQYVATQYGNLKINIIGDNASAYIDDVISPTTAYNMHASNIINTTNNGSLPILSLDYNGLTKHVFQINGNVSFNNTADMAAILGIKGSGSTSATNSLLIQNSAGIQLGYVDDSGQWVLGAGAVKTWFTGNYLVSLNNTTGNGLAITTINNSAYNAIAVNNDFEITGNGRVQLGRSTASSTFTASTHTFNIVAGTTRIVTTQGGGYSQGFTFTGNYGSSKTLSIGSGDPGSGFQGIFYDATKQFGIYKGAFETTTSPTIIATTTNQVGINTATVTAQLQVKGSGTTSGTTAFLVQNSTPSTTFSVTDDGAIVCGLSGQGSVQLGTLNLSYPATISYLSTYGLTISPSTAGSGTISVDGSSMRFLAINNGISYTQPTAKSFLIKKEQGGSDQTSFLNISGADQTDAGQAGAGGVVRIFGGLNNGIAAQGLLVLAHNGTTTQGAVVVGGTSAAISALVDLTSTTQGFLPPRLTTAEKNAIVTPAAGLMVYDTTLNKLCVYTGAGWETITSI
jgi:hypothetical protein